MKKLIRTAAVAAAAALALSACGGGGAGSASNVNPPGTSNRGKSRGCCPGRQTVQSSTS
ncbi:hypothetical protein AHiyo8_31280 [Arthrobacter sp. Hiyo8]|nr:hypothetical protein AHiyo8_31280 [Arthrobacter sp. Hiyo8]